MVAVAVVAGVVRSDFRNGDWRTNLSLREAAVRVAPENFKILGSRWVAEARRLWKEVLAGLDEVDRLRAEIESWLARTETTEVS